MMNGGRPAASRAVAVKDIIRKLGAPKKAEIPRWVLSGKASAQLQAISAATGIPKDQLSDCAIAALAAAMRTGRKAIDVKNDRVRDWLRRPGGPFEGVGDND